MSDIEIKKSKIIDELNSLKAISVLAIILNHYPAYFNAQPLSSIFKLAYSFGHYFVDLLLIISGFVLARSYLDSGRSKKLFRNITHRFLRFYPVYFTALLIVVVLTSFYQYPQHLVKDNNWFHFGLNLFLINYVGAFNGPSWFLSILLLLSIIFFLIIAVVKKYSYRLFALIVLFFSITLLFFSGRIVTAGLYLHKSFVGFFLGTIVFYVDEIIRKRPIRINSQLFDIGFSMSLSFLLVVFWIRIIEAMPLVELIVIFIIFPLLIIASYRGKMASGILTMKVFSFLSKISFSMFLFHYPLYLTWVILSNLSLGFIDFNSGIFFSLYLTSLIFVSYLVTKYIEIPFAKFNKRRIRSGS